MVLDCSGRTYILFIPIRVLRARPTLGLEVTPPMYRQLSIYTIPREYQPRKCTKFEKMLLLRHAVHLDCLIAVCASDRNDAHGERGRVNHKGMHAC